MNTSSISDNSQLQTQLQLLSRRLNELNLNIIRNIFDLLEERAGLMPYLFQTSSVLYVFTLNLLANALLSTMASTASLHKNKKSTLARVKRFLAKDDHFSTSANQIIMKCCNSLHSQIYSSSIPGISYLRTSMQMQTIKFKISTYRM